MLSPGPARGAPLPKEPSEIRCAGLGHLHRAQRRKQRGEREGGANKCVPQRTRAGSNPARSPFQHGKLPAVRVREKESEPSEPWTRRNKDELLGNQKKETKDGAEPHVQTWNPAIEPIKLINS